MRALLCFIFVLFHNSSCAFTSLTTHIYSYISTPPKFITFPYQNDYTNHNNMPAWNETDDRKLLLACIKLSVCSLVFSVYKAEDALTDTPVEPDSQLG